MNSRLCRRCNTYKEPEAFSYSRGSCKECRRLYEAERRAENPEQYRKACRKWRGGNKNKHNEATKAWKKKTGWYKSDKMRTYYRDRMRTLHEDPIERMKGSVRNRVRAILAGISKTTRTFDLLGYSVEELKAHLEAQFRDGMSWDNYGKWHIDHIIPLSRFDIEAENDPEFRKAWALENLQPLWAYENLSKGSRMIDDMGMPTQGGGPPAGGNQQEPT